jgi:predicted flavoprotein YhiN
VASQLNISGQNRFKDEFVECGGVALHEIDFKTMESKIFPGLFFAGEILDVDGITECMDNGLGSRVTYDVI